MVNQRETKDQKIFLAKVTPAEHGRAGVGLRNGEEERLPQGEGQYI